MNSFEKIILYLWGKGYGVTSHDAIVRLLTKIKNRDNKSYDSYVDLGSGDGVLFQKICQSFKPNKAVTCDVRDDVYKSNNHVVCDLNSTRLPFDDNKFDLITCSNVLEHLFDTDTFLKEVNRVLKQGGVFIIITNNLSCWSNIVSLLFGRQPNACHASDWGDIGRLWQQDKIRPQKFTLHRRLFTCAALTSVLRLHGYKIISGQRIIFYPIVGFMARFFEKLFNPYCAYLLFAVTKQG